jgi:hypothetical protein
MRRALLATAAMNLVGALTFTPWGDTLRAFVGMPAGAHPVYLVTIASFVLIFGIAYLWTGLRGHADPLFIAVAAAGKLAFFGVLAGFWLAGELPLLAPLTALGDLVFGAMFVAWLAGVSPSETRRSARGGRAA